MGSATGLQKAYTFSFACPKEKVSKRKGTGSVYGATPVLPFADGAQTRYAQTIAPYLRLTVPTLTHLRLCPRAARWRRCAVIMKGTHVTLYPHILHSNSLPALHTHILYPMYTSYTQYTHAVLPCRRSPGLTVGA